MKKESYEYVESPIFYRSEKGIIRINTADLVAIKGVGKYQELIMVNGKITIVATSREIHKAFCKVNFCRVSRSWIINPRYISLISRYRDYLKLGELEVPVTKGYAARILKILTVV